MAISGLLDYSLPLVGLEVCVVFVAVHFLAEPFLMPRMFGKTYLDMDLTARRSLTNHVISFVMKGMCFIGSYSFWHVFVSDASFDTPIPPNPGRRVVTNGDVLAFCYLSVPTIYMFEIIYRTNISVISAVHHVAAIIINILGLVVVLGHHQVGFVAEAEFKLILIYGAFEMIFEILPHLAVVLYRLRRDRPRFLSILFLGIGLFIFTGTLGEQVAIAIFYHQIWHGLPIFYKTVGPILHFCFMAAQVHGGRICLQIGRKMRAEARDVDGEGERGDGVTENGTRKENVERCVEKGATDVEAGTSSVNDRYISRGVGRHSLQASLTSVASVALTR